MENFKSLFTLLNSLSPYYRAVPFWAWNDKLDAGELIRQIHDMHDKGIGGLCIHSREGLETEYLSDEWMYCVKEAVSAAQNVGQSLWLYDEDKWPSGSAGGVVSAVDQERFTAKGLTVELVTPNSGGFPDLTDDSDKATVYQVTFRDKGDKNLLEFRLLDINNENFTVDIETLYLIFRVEISGTSEWYNGKAPTDILNPDAVQQFIKTTHEKYKTLFKDEFGKTIKGFFTDEPNFCDFFSNFTPGRPWLPWTENLPGYFLKQRGYPLQEILPLLFFHGKGEEKGRYDYWLTLTELFITAYTQQVYDWCENNNLQLTGHMLYENDLGYAVRVSGAAMPHYRYMHVPGIDLLGDQRQEYLAVKQCTSVANQFRRGMVVSETYGCTGWEFSFAGQKRVGDWQYVMGVSRRCQHLSLYSLSGCRKRDYPPSFNYHNSWWEHSGLLEDYFARLSVCVTAGDVRRDILVIHPIGSFWMKSGSSINEDLGNLEMNMGWLDSHILNGNIAGDEYNRLAEKLLMSQLDFDFGDELIMRDAAEVHGSKIRVGQQDYSYIIVPRVETLMLSTVILLETFLEAGGRIFWVAPFPCKIDAVKSDRIKKLCEKPGIIIVNNYAKLLHELQQDISRPIRICDNYGMDLNGFLSMVRGIDDGEVITVVNTEDTAKEVNLRFSSMGRLKYYNLIDGSVADVISGIEYSVDSEEMIIRTHFDREETKVYLFDTTKPPVPENRVISYKHPHAGDTLVQGFPVATTYSLSLENVLVLDRCCFKIRGGEWSAESLLWQGQRILREHFGMRPVFYNGAPQRYTWVSANQSGKTETVKLRFTFKIDIVPESPVYIAVEKSGSYTVVCNGLACVRTDRNFLDRAIQIFRINSELFAGDNTLEIELDYHEGVELENIYLIGIFGVTPQRYITRLPDKLQLGDWTLQGLFHYPGSVKYQYKLPPIDSKWSNSDMNMKLGKFYGTLAILRINNQAPISLLRGDVAVPVTGLLYFDQENHVEIEIVGSLRNTLGPFHRSIAASSRISWEDFRTENSAFMDEYSTVPYGLVGEIAIVVKSDPTYRVNSQ